MNDQYVCLWGTKTYTAREAGKNILPEGCKVIKEGTWDECVKASSFSKYCVVVPLRYYTARMAFDIPIENYSIQYSQKVVLLNDSIISFKHIDDEQQKT